MYVIIETSSTGTGVATLTVYDNRGWAQRVCDRWQSEADYHGVPAVFRVYELHRPKRADL